MDVNVRPTLSCDSFLLASRSAGLLSRSDQDLGLAATGDAVVLGIMDVEIPFETLAS